MYDSREKAILDYESNLIDAREEGRQEGREEGRAIGRIQLLQDLLGDPVTSEESLRTTPIEQLVSMVEELQSKLRQRNV